jgi:hypothetical protein
MLTIKGRERIFLKKRKGFIKLALEQGSEVIPVYAFGESDLFVHSSFLLNARKKFQKVSDNDAS